MIITNCRYENNNYLEHYKPNVGDIVFDVGAHVGEETFLFSNMVGNKGKVVAIEPNPIVYDKLMQQNTDLHNILIIGYGISNECGHKKFYTRKTSSSSGFVDLDDSPQIETESMLPTLTLDALCELLNVDKIDFLKADIEGSEIEMLEGGRNIFKNCIKNVVIACEHKRKGNLTVDRINDLLNEYNFDTDIKDTNVYGTKRK